MEEAPKTLYIFCILKLCCPAVLPSLPAWLIRRFDCREKLSSDERFVDELRTTLRFMFAVIYRRLKKVGFAQTSHEMLLNLFVYFWMV